MPMFQPNHSRPALVGAFLSVLACAALTSCGGGGGDSTAAAPTTPAPGPQQPGSPTPPPPPPPAQATATCGLPNFTTTMNFAGMIGGFLAETTTTGMPSSKKA